MWQKPPILFPLVALFHIGLLIYYIADTLADPNGMLIWGQSVFMLLYTIFWLFCCDLRRWAALGYIAMTTLNLVLRFVLTDTMDLVYFTDTLFPVDILFTFFVMFYFKRFD